MAEVINLRRVRKKQAREAADDLAAGNRLRFGQTRAERQLAERQRDKAARDLDAHVREKDE